MGTLLESLQQLQQIESKLHELRQKINRKKRSIRAHERKLVTLEAEIAAKHEETKSAQMASDTLDLEVKGREQEIAKLRENLNKARTNKEYSVLLTQINTAKADNLKVEERILQKMTAVDEAKEAEQKLCHEREQLQRRIEELGRVSDSFAAEVADDLASFQRQRDEIAEELPPSALAAFNRVAEKHDGEAMARIDRPDPRRSDYICEGCNMSIATEVVNALMTKDEIQVCQICGRILYLDTQPV